MAPGLALPQKGRRWDPENEQWTRGVVTIVVVASFLMTVVISGLVLLTQKASAQDIVAFLNVILTPTGIIVGYYFGRRSVNPP
jgi:hypothetical protein